MHVGNIRLYALSFSIKEIIKDVMPIAIVSTEKIPLTINIPVWSMSVG